MPLVKTLHGRGANVVVEAHAEVLCLPTGDIGRWTRKFSTTVKRFVALEAPVNKRPRWAHYGKPLKSTIRATTKYRPSEGRVYGAVGSTSPHGYYVDQGTGVYAGGSPYPAKILPPWTHGGPGLYEHTWRPGGGKSRVSAVMIKGQKGQGFLDAGLSQGFRAMRLARGTGGPKMAEAASAIPTGLEDFLGNTVADGAFLAQLKEWRQWRDTAWIAKEEGKRASASARRRDKAAKAAATQAAILAEFTTRRKNAKKAANQAAYQASVDAAKRRAEAQAAKLLAQRARKEEGDRRRAEQAEREKAALAARKAVRVFEAARLKAYQYMHAIEGAYPDAEVQVSKDRSIIRVHYTGPSGPVNEYFLGH